MIKRILCVIAVLLLGCAHAKTVGCIDAKLIGLGLIDRVCWSCVFPIRVAGIPISGASQANRYPQEAAKQKFCMCNDSAGVPHPGIVTSFWQPAYLAEYQRVSGCSSVLNGIRFPTNRLFQGSERRSAEDVNKGQLTFRHYHFYSFPLMHMLDVFVPANCNPGGFHDLDMMYISELDPTWNNDELAFFTSFEAALVSNPLGIAACGRCARYARWPSLATALVVCGFLGARLSAQWQRGCALGPLKYHVTYARQNRCRSSSKGFNARNGGR